MQSITKMLYNGWTVKDADTPDYRTITLANPGDIENGNVKITAVINGKKYTATVKARVKS